ncbi:MAG: cold-shock protein [Vicinamibacterales bacterium]
MPRPSRAASTKPLYTGTETKGRIKSIVRGQGTGIISAPDGDVFFHKSDFQGSFLDLTVGDRVVFELLADAIIGPRAQNVRVVPARKAR